MKVLYEAQVTVRTSRFTDQEIRLLVGQLAPRDSRWYDDPGAFQLDRWTDEFRSSLPRLAYFPFGAGLRRCVGERFALMEVTFCLFSRQPEKQFC
ncbi:cytochrome P450 [Natrinema sp. SYSU A 869]|uniref:cytochrome P450 n=1 Tax=Natrinema sp. SYSU A 869 TaxID=2871694 RepID=UPI0031F31AF2